MYSRGTNIKYLNTSSTNYPETNQLNMSDVFYKENGRDRDKIRVLEAKIKKIVGAPNYAYVVFNSGATEGIATAVHWCSKIYPHFIIVGSGADHSAVESNSKIYGVQYMKCQDIENLDNSYNDRTGMIFITHVDSKTGEINDVNKIAKRINDMKFLQCQDLSVGEDEEYNFYKAPSKLTQYKPIIALDVTQSILKVPIKMQEWGINIAFWSDHKLGGDMGRGCMVIIPNAELPFVPLIAGAQNHNLRGGSLSSNVILQESKIYDHLDNPRERIKHWIASCKYLESKGVSVYHPKKQHLFNTILIDTKNKCPYSVISKLSEDGIYMSPKSACMAEKRMNNLQGGDSGQYGVWQDLEELQKGGDIDPQYSGKPFENAIRLSFLNPDVLDEGTLNKICECVLD